MKAKFLIFAFVVQFLLIGAMFFNAYLPIFFGTQIKVKATGYDPRDLLVGNFVRFDYNISLKNDLVQSQEREFFVLLDEKEGIFGFKEIVLNKPKDRLYIKAKRASIYSQHLQMGIEKYFVSQKRAIELEKSLNLKQNTALVSLKIHKGRARIVDFELEKSKE